jgi:hypothetical protein
MIHLKEQKRHLAQCLEAIAVVHFSVQILGQFGMQTNRQANINNLTWGDLRPPAVVCLELVALYI